MYVSHHERKIPCVCECVCVCTMSHQGTVSEEGKAVMEEVEKEQSYEELTVLRRLVMTHIKTERELAEVKQQQQQQQQQTTNNTHTTIAAK